MTMITELPYSVQHVADDEPLWRYMKLSTFLLLCKGEVFIPSLTTLQATDPNEGLLPLDSDESPDYLSLHPSLLEAERWLLKKTRKWERDAIRGNADRPRYSQAILAKVWAREAAKRRCVWCWHAANIESMALWNVYAHQGVAVRSDCASIRAALRLQEPYSAVVGKVRYINREESNPAFQKEELLLRPYFFKQKCYEHEKEVRFVFAVKETKKAIRVAIDPKILIKQVLVSPWMISDEARAIRDIVRASLDETAEIDSSIELSRDLARDSFARMFISAMPQSANPFTLPDSEPEIFKTA